MNSLRCEWCGQHASDEYPVWGHKENIDSPYMVSHQTQGYCIMAALARAEVLEVAFANSHNLNESLGDENRALLARAEAAEAERNELRERHDNLKNAYANLVEEAAERLVRRLVRMYAAERRVAELEAQLAAQGWRPVTITEPSLNVMAELLIVGYRGDDGYWHYPDGPEGLVIRGWRPVQVAATEENQQ